ncbi:MAG: hypothetical protein NVSMB16_08510 [Acidimicrobiales bacterium]
MWDPDHPGAPFVVEADESDGTFLELGARDVIVTNVEADHLDHWGDFANLSAGFARFVTAAPGHSLVGIDDKGGAALAASTGATTFGSVDTADWRLLEARPARSGSHLVVAHHGEPVAEIELAGHAQRP